MKEIRAAAVMRVSMGDWVIVFRVCCIHGTPISLLRPGDI